VWGHLQNRRSVNLQQLGSLIGKCQTCQNNCYDLEDVTVIEQGIKLFVFHNRCGGQIDSSGEQVT
jgi:hypothetical protein